MFDDPNLVLAAWADGVNAGHVDKVVSLYNEDAVLLPTFSNKTLHTSEGIKDYFVKLADRKDLSVLQHEKHYIIHQVIAKIYSLSGIYRWAFEVEDDMMTFEARFTFTLDLNLAGPILHHHSSQVPRML